MSYDVANEGRYVFYVNFETIGDGTNRAIASQRFEFAQLIEDSSKYVISVERARIPLQSIPMLPGIDNAIVFVPKDGASEPNPINTRQTFSINDWFKQIQDMDPPGLIITLTSDARVSITYDAFSDFTLLLDPVVQQIFDMDNPVGIGIENGGVVVGNSPIFDRFDDLHSINIEATQGLSSVQQELENSNVYNTLLTDLLVGSNESMSYDGEQNDPIDGLYSLTFPVRADLELQAGADRRWIMLKGTAPVQSIQLECVAIFRDGTRHEIILPPRGILSIKIAFWRK